MTEAIPTMEPAPAQLAVLYEPVREELSRVETVLRAELRSGFPFVDELVRHSFRVSGKRLRPALLLLVAKAIGRVTDDHIKLAAVVEMIHTATLVHDDVLDGASLRRHLPTVNAGWGNEASVLLGDYLFTHSFFLASTTSSTLACQRIGSATNRTCEGELRQINSRGDFSLSEQEYLDIIRAKTAELCACSCLLGAHFAGARDELAEAMERFGRNLGIAFQIVDDVLDLLGDERSVGKSLGTDIQQQKATLPVIRSLQQADPQQRAALIAALAGGDSNHPTELWLDDDAVEYARDRAAGFARAAAGELAELPAGPARQVLLRLTEFVVTRDH